MISHNALSQNLRHILVQFIIKSIDENQFAVHYKNSDIAILLAFSIYRHMIDFHHLH